MLTETKTNSIFRKEFIQQLSPGISGEVWLGAPWFIKIAVAIIVPIVLAGLWFVALAKLPKHERVSGWLVHQGGVIRTTVRSTGVITSLVIKETQKVEKGQLLARISVGSQTGSGEVGRALQNSASSEIAASNEEQAAAVRLLEEEQAGIQRQIEVIRQEQLTKEQLSINLEARAKLVEHDLDRAESLVAQGYVTSAVAENRRREMLLAEQAILENKNSLNTIKGRVIELESRSKLIPSRVAEINARRGVNVAAFKQKLTQIEAQTVEVLTAPISGTIAALPASIGQTISPGNTVALITPAGQQLEAELFLPSRTVGFVRVGQEVALYFQAFPHQRYGKAKGKVSSISSTSLSPTEISIPGHAIKEPVFKIRVILSSQFMNAYQKNIPLQSGMLLDANITIQRRSLVDILMDPILAVGERS